MSMEAVLMGTRDHLRERIDQVRDAIDVMADGRPAPSCGDWFFAVHEGVWRFDRSVCDYGQALAEVFGVQVTVTRKCGVAPYHRIGTEVLAKEWTGLLAMCRRVILAIDDDQDLRAKINVLIGADADGIVTPLWFEDGGSTSPRGPDWFQARGQKANLPCGMSRTLTFGGAQRVQGRSGRT